MEIEIFDINTAEELLDELLNEENIIRGDISPEIMKKVEENIKKYFLNIKSIWIKKLINFRPNTTIKFGIGKFIDWYLKYYNVKKKD